MSAPEPSPAEQAAIDRFGIFEGEEARERVAQAMHRAVCDCDQGATNIDRKMAAAAIAVMPASPAEEALRRVEALLAEGDEYEWNGATHNSRIRAAIAAPQTGQHTTGEEER